MTEDEHQEKIFEWVESNLSTYPELEFMYANMNGARRSKRYTAKLKRRGMRAGVPDIFLPVARYNFHGLYIELKRPKTTSHAKGILSPKQKRWKGFLTTQNYAHIVCYGYKHAIETIKYYLDQEF